MDLEGGFDDTDVDEDSVPAIIEEILGTSDYLDDTDGDGISDYIEIYEIDPTLRLQIQIRIPMATAYQTMMRS